MRLHLSFAILVIACCICVEPYVQAQDLAPRAYVITPIHTNAITLTYAFYSGNLDFGNIPITDATARSSVPVLSYFHSLSLLGRTASAVASAPDGSADFRGAV